MEHVPKLKMILEHRFTTLADVGFFVSCPRVPMFQDFAKMLFYRDLVYKEERGSLKHSLWGTCHIGTLEQPPALLIALLLHHRLCPPLPHPHDPRGVNDTAARVEANLARLRVTAEG